MKRLILKLVKKIKRLIIKLVKKIVYKCEWDYSREYLRFCKVNRFTRRKKIFDANDLGDIRVVYEKEFS